MTPRKNRKRNGVNDGRGRSVIHRHLLDWLHHPGTLVDRLLLAQVLGPPRCRTVARRRRFRRPLAP
jgi:hypothetical protein